MIAKIFRLGVCLGSFLYTFYVLIHFMHFLSKHNYGNNDVISRVPEEQVFSSTLWILLVNLFFVSLFIIQHSVMASDSMKEIYQKLGLEDVERSIYNVFCAAALHMLITNWQQVTWISLWNIDTSKNNTIWLFMTALHVIAWFIIYSGCIMMDISELAGIKQVCYKISRRPPPMALKSRELQRYLGHMRHPSFTCFSIILWGHPVMSIDRVLLASLLTLYMIMLWSIDKQDFDYHSVVIKRKQANLQSS